MTYPYRQQPQTYTKTVKFKDSTDYSGINPVVKFTTGFSVILLICILMYGIYKAIITW